MKNVVVVFIGNLLQSFFSLGLNYNNNHFPLRNSIFVITFLFRDSTYIYMEFWG